MRQKRVHRKSREGCFTCRKRRVKCDETQPVCTNCARRGEQCNYPLSALSDLPNPYPEYPIASTQTSLSAVSPPSTSHIIADMNNMLIFHHYTSHTCLYGLHPNSNLQALRQIHTPRLGFQFPFLLHALLSLGALDLHLLHEEAPSDLDYLALSKSHIKRSWDEPLPVNRAAANDTKQQALARFFQFVILAMSSMHSPGIPGGQAWKPKILVWICNCREMYSKLKSGPDGMLLETQVFDLLHEAYEGAKHPVQWSITSMNDSSAAGTQEGSTMRSDLSTIHLPWGNAPNPEEVTDAETSRVYQDAVCKLQSAYLLSLQGENGMAGLISWTVTILPSFLQFMLERRPRALVILAHFHLLAMTLSHKLGLRPPPDETVQKIFEIMDPHWSSWMSMSISQWQSWLVMTVPSWCSPEEQALAIAGTPPNPMATPGDVYGSSTPGIIAAGAQPSIPFESQSSSYLEGQVGMSSSGYANIAGSTSHSVYS